MDKVKGWSVFFRKNIVKLLMCLVGLAIMGIGVALNDAARFGNDPITVFYDGVAHLFSIKLGIASFVINWGLFSAMLILARKYINVGTVMYVLLLGVSINIAEDILNAMNLLSFPGEPVIQHTFMLRVALSVIGSITVMIGVALFVYLDVGVDNWTALTLSLSDKFNIPFKYMKIICDIICVMIGFLCGGVVGITTLMTAFLGGPIINWLVNLFKEVRRTTNK